jgi:hypothetical protein
MLRSSALLAFVSAAALAACGDNLPGPADAGLDGATAFVEAPHPAVAQLISGGGPVMTAPIVVPVFFAGDGAMQTQVEGFLHALATSSYWTATTAEYGVGALTVGPTVVSSDVPPNTDDGLALWLKAKTDGAHPGWPAPGPNTVFAVFTPKGTTITSPGSTSCVDYVAYHDEVAGSQVIYALMPRCDDTLDSQTDSLSHELVEAATDPHPTTAYAFGDVDPDHAWLYMVPGAESGDLCEYVHGVDQRLVGTYLVQRTWSNASALAGHDPCVPALAEPYVAAAPVLTDTVKIDFGDGQGAKTATKGVAVPLGMTKTIDVALYGDAPSADWTVAAFDVNNEIFGGGKELSLAVVPAVGHNGSHVALSITRLKNAGAASVVPNGSMFLLSAKVNGATVSQTWGFATN